MLGPELDDGFVQAVGLWGHPHVVLPLHHGAAFAIDPAGGDAGGEIVGNLVEPVAGLGPTVQTGATGRLAHVGQPVGGIGGIDDHMVVLGGLRSPPILADERRPPGSTRLTGLG